MKKDKKSIIPKDTLRETFAKAKQKWMDKHYPTKEQREEERYNKFRKRYEY